MDSLWLYFHSFSSAYHLVAQSSIRRFLFLSHGLSCGFEFRPFSFLGVAFARGRERLRWNAGQISTLKANIWQGWYRTLYLHHHHHGCHILLVRIKGTTLGTGDGFLLAGWRSGYGYEQFIWKHRRMYTQRRLFSPLHGNDRITQPRSGQACERARPAMTRM